MRPHKMKVIKKIKERNMKKQVIKDYLLKRAGFGVLILLCQFVIMFSFVNCDGEENKAEKIIPVVTLALSEIKQDGALSNVTITPVKAKIKEAGIVYSKSEHPRTDDYKITSKNEDLSFELYLTDMETETQYYVRAYAVNNAGDIFYSNEVGFSTAAGVSADPMSPTEIVNEYSGFEMKWADEFNTNGSPLSTNWSYESGYVRNNEAQYYSSSSENAAVNDGCLVITARKDHDGRPYTSSSLHTGGKHYFMFGRFEVRAKIPTSDGCWPAIWTVGNKFDWPIGGEIDIMEFYDKSILANAAWSANQAWTAVWDSKKIPITHWTNNDANWADKFHVWRMDWNYDAIKLYLDGQLLNTINLNETFNKGWNGNTDNPFRPQASDFGQYFILNLALGGNNGGTIDDSKFPIDYKIDYIRAYQAIE